ncbi:MAG: diguanylate cyclase, partial [Blautia sp.]|nr:diguanylate cyclase [Blautia sp.]
ENLRRRVDGHVFPEVKHLTISLGVISALGMEDRKSIYTNVDNALYQAKDSGRNCIVQCRN